MSNITLSRDTLSSEPMAQAGSHQDPRERTPARCRSTALRRSANVLIASALIGFAALHFIGGAVIHAASNASPPSHHTLAAD